PHGVIMSPLCPYTSATSTAIYPHSLHVALPIYEALPGLRTDWQAGEGTRFGDDRHRQQPAVVGRAYAGARMVMKIGILALQGALDRKSTRLNSSHVSISYAVFCLKKKRKESMEK